MPLLDYNATVSQRVEIAPGLMILRLVPDVLPFVFQAGQYTVLGMKGTVDDPEKLVRRAYSIASSSRAEAFIEFYLALVRSGELTPKLFSLRVSDRLFMGAKATGMFTLARVPSDKHVILVATGTGLAPYMSMLRSEIVCGGAQKVVVLHGARYSWDLAYRTELMALSSKCPNISYLPVVSQGAGDPTWRGLTGFLQDVLFSGEVEGRAGIPLDPEQAHVFLCGNPRMVDAAKARLVAERGYVPDHKKEIGTLHLEEYW
jgi:ferredoxin/flavodoxin---NADP+ reductase